MTYVPSITDDLLAEIEAECRDNGHDAETLSMIRRVRESEARLWSICTAKVRGDTARLDREVIYALDYILETLRT